MIMSESTDLNTPERILPAVDIPAELHTPEAALPAVDAPAARANLLQYIGSIERETLISRLLVLAAIVFNLYWLWPEVAISVPQLNDGVLHQLVLGRTIATFSSGES